MQPIKQSVMLIAALLMLTSCERPANDKPTEKSTGGVTPSAGTSNSNVVEDVSGNHGTLTIGVGAFQSNPGSQQCFPSSQGWDKYFVVTNYFIGQDVLPVANCYTNVEHLPSVTVTTCDPANGTTLQTGIVIQHWTSPSDKVCATNSPGCTTNTGLTTATRSMATGLTARYRATVFYKSNTLGGLTSITVNWSYP